jgi:lipooligosaccharide transport system ATP-binding protein
MDMIIKARNLSKHFDGFCAVDNIDFEIGRGEIFGFLGPNGAGKTTTMRMINCFFPPTSGELSVDDMNVRSHRRQIKRILGVIPQEDNLDPDFTLERNLRVYARYYNIRREVAEQRIEYLLDFLKLSELRKSPIESLSGGMKRRLLIARGLINEPRILLLDEPTTGLDPQARRLIWDKIKELQAEGLTAILTTHYMGEASYLCDRVAIMRKGKISDIDSPRSLIDKYIGREDATLEDVFLYLTGKELSGR